METEQYQEEDPGQGHHLKINQAHAIVNPQALGICIGAATLSLIHIRADASGQLHAVRQQSVTTWGNPRELLETLLAPYAGSSIAAVVTGRKFRHWLRLTSISEPEATEVALQLYLPQGPFTALASLGAETFLAYELNGLGQIRRLISGNQCTSGTGEFFMQQIGRMNLGLDDAVKLSAHADPFGVSGRCSVFCKSDCTHALNKGISLERVTAGLAMMIASKTGELLKKARPGKVLMAGGVTRNTTVMDFLRRDFPDLYIPQEAPYLEALGAAVYGLTHEVTNYTGFHEAFAPSGSLFTFHKPLKEFSGQAIFHSDNLLIGQGGGECILGLDVGSTTTKGVLLRCSDNKILASAYLYTHGNPVGAARKVYHALEGQLSAEVQITGLGVTGSGRHISALHAGTTAIINEISAHACAAVFFDAGVDTLFEIGGQDAKYTLIHQRVPVDYAMNEACSAGTGSFIQEAALESLDVKLEEIETGAMAAESPLNFRDQCAALIGADIKMALQENFSRQDVLAGLVYSICMNYINRVKGNRPVGNKIFMQGGVCYNKAIPVAMAALTGKTIVVPPLPGLMGAFGVALKVKEDLQSGRLKPKTFVLSELVNRDIVAGAPFVCHDRNCDRKCTINTYRVEGKTFAFGGACNRYYDALRGIRKTWHNYDLVSWRMEHMLHKETPAQPLLKTVGLSPSFCVNRLLPLYQKFFQTLGFGIVMPDAPDPDGLENQHSSFCFPGELAHGLFARLLSLKPDYIFMPELYEMHVQGCEKDMKDSCATCVFISKEAAYLSQAFADQLNGTGFIHPYLNFARGYHTQKEVFREIGKQLGVKSRNLIDGAYRLAVQAQLQSEKELHEKGQQVLRELDENPAEIAMVIFGRDYNAFSSLANKGIPQKIASLGYRVIPWEMLPIGDEPVPEFQSWEAGKNLLRAATLLSRHPRLFAVYISNFSCGPDSMLIPSFREVMGNKPSLTLELDQHTADAGINTRIDAFLDVVENYRKIASSRSQSNGSDFRPARIEGRGGKAVFVDSQGQEFDMKYPQVKFVVPCMGDMAAALFAASLRSLGYNAVALPEMDMSILNEGQRFTTGKECLPVVLLAGSLLKIAGNGRMPGDKLAFINIGGTSACRIAQYPGLLHRLIGKQQIPDAALFTLISQEGYLGLSEGFLKRSMDAIILNDVLEDVRSGILANAVEPEKGIEFFYQEFDTLTRGFAGDYNSLYALLEQFAIRIAQNIPSRRPASAFRYIALTGEIFVRHNQFAHKKLNYYFGKKGFVLKDAYISEWIRYLDYAWRKGVDRPDFSPRETLSRLLREQYIGWTERRMHKILARSGYVLPHKTRVAELIGHSLHVLPLESTGEPALTLGTALAQGYQQYCGIINIGPFGCLQTRIGEAICQPNMYLGAKKKVKDRLKISYQIPEFLGEDTEIPFLTIECDGKGFPQLIESRLEAFLVQIERAAGNMEKCMLGK